jgi:hypothetical protein
MPKIISDAAGGAIVVWQDYRTGEYDLYAQRFNATGVRQWTSTGIPLCTAPGNQWSVPFVSDGAGGAIVTWPDLRTGTYDVYAQHVTASGGVTWTMNGAGLCTAAGPQSVPSIAPNGSGGAIVSWTDERDGNRDIYGQRVSANGEWGYPEPSITSVVDVPGDQGRHVRVRWNEGDKGASQSYYYEVYRNTGGTWSYVGAVGDNGGASYNLAVETLDDSTCWVPFSHQFQVRAWGAFLTPDISNTVLGRSIDNLVPPAPVLTEQHVGGTVTLDWTPSPAADFNNYSVYLSSVPGQLGTVFDTVYDATYTIEFAPPYPDQYWSVAAWDVHCNRGAPSNQVALLFPNTLVGTNVSVAPWDDGGTATHPAYLEFSNVTTEGRTSLNITSTGPSLPGTFSAGDGKYYNLTTTATTTGNIQVCIQYNESALSVPETNLRLLHYDTVAVPAAWVDITNYLDTVNNVVCGLTDHLSPFVIGAGSVTAVGDGRALRCALYDAVPNPFNPQTTIRYDVVAGGAHVNISIFDVAGRRVRELVDERRAAGTWSVQWNGDDDHGQRVASGVYFYRMRAGGFTETRKMVLLK